MSPAWRARDAARRHPCAPSQAWELGKVCSARSPTVVGLLDGEIEQLFARILMVADYAELHCHSNFSFLDGASHPIELALQAKELGLRSMAITDTGGVYGVVRFVDACKKAGVHAVIGTCLEVDGRELVLLARTRAGYSNLCRLLSLAHRDQPKGEARTTLGTLEKHRADLYCLAASDDAEWLGSVRDALGRDQVFVELHNHRRQEDLWVLEGRVELAGRLGLDTVATNHVRYHHRTRRPLHDA